MTHRTFNRIVTTLVSTLLAVSTLVLVGAPAHAAACPKGSTAKALSRIDSYNVDTKFVGISFGLHVRVLQTAQGCVNARGTVALSNVRSKVLGTDYSGPPLSAWDYTTIVSTRSTSNSITSLMAVRLHFGVCIPHTGCYQRIDTINYPAKAVFGPNGIAL